MSFGSITNVARSALRVSQLGVQVAGSNIANAQTEGYSRQRLDLYAASPDITALGRIGTGVGANVSRVRDQLADAVYRRETGRAADYGARSEVLGQLEGVLGEPSETGLAADLDAFWNAWSDLGSQPTNPAARAMVRQRGATLAASLNRVTTQVDDVVGLVKSRLTQSVQQLNSLATRVAESSAAIVRAEAGGPNQASDLRDQRDRLLDEMAKLGGTTVVEGANGTVKVVVDGATLVDGTSAWQLDAPSFTRTGSQLLVSVTSGGEPVQFAREGSVIGQLTRVVNQDVYGPDGLQSRLDELASGLVGAMNRLHRQGPAGVDFFDPSGTTASSIRLSAAVQADAGAVASRYAAGAANDNQLALDVAALRGDTTTMGAGTRSFGGDYQDLVSRLAVKTSAAKNSRTAFEALATQAENQRSSVSGVSTDEELIRIVQFQQSYTAASKLLKVADEMLESLLNLR